MWFCVHWATEMHLLYKFVEEFQTEANVNELEKCFMGNIKKKKQFLVVKRAVSLDLKLTKIDFTASIC